MTTSDGLPKSGAEKAARTIRWWPAVLVLMAAIGVLFWIWGWYGVSRQQRIIATAQVIVYTVALLLLWLVLASSARWGLRWTVLGIVIGSMIISATLFRIRGVTGDLVPILEFRWKRQSIPTTATNLTNAVPQGVSRSDFDFPQFLGPNRNGTVVGPRLNRNWEAKPPHLLWRQPIGAAWSGFAISGEHAVTQEQRGQDEMVTCYDLQSGQLRWSHSNNTRYATTIAGEGPRATPTIVSNRVFTLGATGILDCLELSTGKSIWSKDLIQDNRSEVPDWGLAGSPLAVDDLIVVNAGGPDGRSLVAYDQQSGQFIWGGGNERADYSSPYLATIGGTRQILIFNPSGVASHELKTGKILWEYPWPGGHPHVALPVVLPDDGVLISSGYGTGAERLRIQSEKNWLPRSVWKSRRLKSKFANLVFHDGFIFGLDDGILVCLDASNGDLKWKEGRYGHGQMILVGDVLLLMAESGEVVLIEPVPDEHRKLASFPALRSKTWNPPALAGEYLLVRNDKEAACYRLPIVK